MTPREQQLVAEEAAELGVPYDPARVVRRTAAGLSVLVWAAAPDPQPAGDPSGATASDGPGPARELYLHGGGLNAHTWDATILLRGRAAVAVDLPGHGSSDAAHEGDHRPTTSAARVAQALDALVADGVVEPPLRVVGQSLGGVTALRLAAARPDLVAAVVLVDVLPLPADAARAVQDFLGGASGLSSREELVARAEAFGLGGTPGRLRRQVELNTRELPDGRVELAHRLGRDLAAFRGDLLGPAEEVWALVADLLVPLALVRGDRGIVGQDLVDRWRAARPDAPTLTVAAGHNVQEDDPVALADALAAVLDQPRDAEAGRTRDAHGA